ncbi:DUF2796 domain-containing protein, partial [bacterium]|nr:DUF2796 domain-containing protein [bacterium]
MKTKLPFVLATIAMAAQTTAVWAETERQHGAHEHGAATLSLAVDQHQLLIALESPSVNVFGFEHAPSSEAQHQAVDAAVAQLRDEALWTFSRAAQCRLETVEIDSVMLDDEHHDDDHDADHHDDDEHHDDDHGHDDSDHDDSDHDDADHHDEHEAEAESSHSDVDVSWHFYCDHPEKLESVQVGLFDAFAGFEDLDVQYLT